MGIVEQIELRRTSAALADALVTHACARLELPVKAERRELLSECEASLLMPLIDQTGPHGLLGFIYNHPSVEKLREYYRLSLTFDGEGDRCQAYLLLTPKS